MKDEKFRELLGEKLGRVEMTPPADMWARLEDSLDKVRAEGKIPAEAGGAAHKPETGEGAEKGVSIRRPVRRKMNWAYIAASIAACVLIVLVISNLDVARDQLVDNSGIASGTAGTEKTEGITQPGIAEGTNRIHADDAIGGNRDLDRRAAANIVVPGRQGDGVKYAGTDKATGEEPGTIAAAGATNTIEKADGATRSTEGIPAEKDNEAATGIHGHTMPPAEQDKTSDTKRVGGSDVYKPVDAEYGRRKRRATPVATSLYAANLGGSSEAKVENINRPLQMGSGMYNAADMEVGLLGAAKRETVSLSDVKHRLPLSFGVNVGVKVHDRITVESGITYTYMQSEWTETGVNWERDVEQKLHYVGIPVNVKYDFIDRDVFDVYVSMGGAIERCVSGKQVRKVVSGNNGQSDEISLRPKGVQLSVGANVGIEVKLGKSVGLYAEPGVGYFFKNEQPANYRTENPFSFTLKAGLRINL